MKKKQYFLIIDIYKYIILYQYYYIPNIYLYLHHNHIRNILTKTKTIKSHNFKIYEYKTKT